MLFFAAQKKRENKRELIRKKVEKIPLKIW